MNCRLCLSNNRLIQVDGDDSREYFLCENCKLINVHPDHFPEKEEEKERYLTHKNGIQYEGYVKFLSRAIDPVMKYLTKSMIGLDYGCGYAPTVSKILKKSGIDCENYDPFFIKNGLDKKYDFIFSTAVFEHFFNPDKEMRKISDILKAEGKLIIMTERWKNLNHFSNWYYTRDPSHVAFYHDRTFDYLAKNYGFIKLFDDKSRVIILQKNGECDNQFFMQNENLTKDTIHLISH